MNQLKNTREKYIRDTFQATDAEVAYIHSLKQLRRSYPCSNSTCNAQPSDILDSWLFQGGWKHATDPTILQSLSITHIINVTESILPEQSQEILHIPTKNGRLAELSKCFDTTNRFLDACYQHGHRVLVHCERGVSRSSTIVLAYLIHHKKWTVLQAYEYLLTKRPEAAPNYALLLQLIRQEHTSTHANNE